MLCKTHWYLTVIPKCRIITTSRQFLSFKKIMFLVVHRTQGDQAEHLGTLSLCPNMSFVSVRQH